MKKVFFFLVTLLSIIAFIACQKQQFQENGASSEKSKFDPTNFRLKSLQAEDLVNPDNPFDSIGLALEVFYVAISTIAADTNYADDSTGFMTAYDNKIDEYSALFYPSVSTSGFNSHEEGILAKFFEDLKGGDLLTVTSDYETDIKNDGLLNNLRKNRLFSIISQVKFGSFYAETYMPAGLSDFDTCMDRELGEIFVDDGNPIPEIAFTAGLPGSLLWLEAECIWEALQSW
jgi:hypothetical protein